MTTTQKRQGVLVSNYLFFENKNGSENAKRFKRKMQKYNIWKYFNVQKYNQLETDFCNILKTYLIQQKSQKYKHPIGILIDSIVPLSDVTIIPPAPHYYDILYLESDILEYKDLSNKFQDESVNWTKAKVRRSGHFVINSVYIDKILSILNQDHVKTMTDFFKYIHTHNEEYEPILNSIKENLYSTLQSKITLIRQHERERLEQELKKTKEINKKELQEFYSQHPELKEEASKASDKEASEASDKEASDKEASDKEASEENSVRSALIEIKNRHSDKIYELNKELEEVDKVDFDEIKECIKEYEKEILDMYLESDVIFTWSCTVCMSQREEYYVHKPHIKQNETKLRMDFISSDRINKEYKLKRDNLYKSYETKLRELKYNNVNIESIKRLNINVHDLPQVSFLMPYTNPENLYHGIITFLKMDYPRYKLELVIIDDTGSEKKYKHMLPDDSRIRIVNVSDKNDKEKRVSLGYKLNAGMSYSTHEITMHLFDTSNYVLDLKTIIIEFIRLNKPCMMSNKTGIYPNKEYDIPDIANMIYLKSYWRVNKWIDDLNTIDIETLYHFIYNRINTIVCVPFIYIGFDVKRYQYQDNQGVKEDYLPFKLDTLVHSKLKESFTYYIKAN